MAIPEKPSRRPMPHVEIEVRPLYSDAAQRLWDRMDKNEKLGVRFGLFPATKMAEAEGEFLTKYGEFDGLKLSVALMDCATKNGGMRA